MSEFITYPLSPLDWLMPRSYINHIICFAASSSSAPEVLRRGLADTLRDIPYLASEIVDQEYPKGSIALSERRFSVDDLFRVRDLSTATYYTDLRAQDFSPSSLKGLDSFLEDFVPGGSCSPVFRAVFLLLNGGSVLSVSVHHSTTDITGFGALLEIWASHCSPHSSQPIGFSADWLDRRALLPPSSVAPNAALINLPTMLHIEVADSGKKSRGHDNAEHLDTLIFKFSGDALRGLKDEVTKHLDTCEVPWVSTSDVLYGLLWSAVIYAEDQERMGATTLDVAQRGTSDQKEERRMRFPVNVRSRLRPPLPKNYLGSAFGVALATVDDKDLIEIITKDADGSIAALARVAAVIRKSIITVDNEAVEEVVTFLAAQDDLIGFKLGQQATNLSIVSWADENVYNLDWGKEIGRCEAVRIPALKNKRYPVILPRRLNGDLEFFVCFNKSTMDVFKEVLNSHYSNLSQFMK
ncbi:unnamed protein product [Clonostachys rosea]|uniref:Uncharacterized protein n=1 Tax=Bionectria ochroleuca TaxID=29856 RepID=A0ABY6USR9_BIOOC|nr:unnamed protein product [Clonostachys rosea]